MTPTWLGLARARGEQRSLWIKGRDGAAACLSENQNVPPSLELEEDAASGDLQEGGCPGAGALEVFVTVLFPF